MYQHCHPSANENGLFKQIKESRGYWLNQERTLEYYDIKSGDTLVYTKKYRPLRVQTLDGSVKTLLVDKSQTVAELTIVICEKFGRLIYSLYFAENVDINLKQLLLFQVCTIQRSFPLQLMKRPQNSFYNVQGSELGTRRNWTT